MIEIQYNQWAGRNRQHNAGLRMIQNPETFDKLVSYTLIEHPYDNRVLDSNRQHDVPWGDFVELMLTQRYVSASKDSVKLIAPIHFLDSTDPLCQHAMHTKKEAERGYGTEDEKKLDAHGQPYTWRGAWNVDAWWMLPVDIDGQQSIDQARAFFSDYTYVAYTSHSHMADGSTEKFRLFLLLEHPVPHAEFEKRRDALLKWLGPIDTSSLAASRAFFLPSCPSERLPLAKRWYNEGNRRLDAMSFDVAEPVEVSESVPPSEADQPVLLDMLRETFLGKYEEWWKVSVAMASAGFSPSDFRYVTIGGMMHKKDARDCENQWHKALASVKRGRTIHVGYLYNLVGGGRAVKKRTLELEIQQLRDLIGTSA